MVRRLWNRTRLLELFISKKLGHAFNLSATSCKGSSVRSVNEGEDEDRNEVLATVDEVLHLLDYVSSIMVARKLL